MDIFLFLAAEEGLSNWEDISELICQTLLSDPNIITSMILLCQLGFLIIFVLDFDKYLSIINFSIDTIYKISYHTDINSIGWGIYFHKCVCFYKDVNEWTIIAKYITKKIITRNRRVTNGEINIVCLLSDLCALVWGLVFQHGCEILWQKSLMEKFMKIQLPIGQRKRGRERGCWSLAHIP